MKQLVDELGSDFLLRLTKVKEVHAQGRTLLFGEVADSLHLNQNEIKNWLAGLGLTTALGTETRRQRLEEIDYGGLRLGVYLV